jgi:hypothetical protein
MKLLAIAGLQSSRTITELWSIVTFRQEKKKAMARSGLLIQVIYVVFVLIFYYFMD